jgi:hypothetical protein
MDTNSTDFVAKVHPATRELLPDDPLEMQAFEVPGDPELMLRFIVEEYARIGANADAIMQLAGDPFYQALHGLWLHFGDDGMRARLANILRRCGVIRTTTTERVPPPDTVQIQLPTAH